MPYITTKRRTEIDDFVENNAGDLFDIGYYALESPGELNYTLTTIIKGYLEMRGGLVNYQRINDIVGALEGAKLEFYRRVAAPYEDEKIKENGDVY